jgi:ferredoxin-NADP reductase
VLLTRPILDISAATPRARIIHIDLQGTPFPFLPGQAIWLGAHGQDVRRPYSIASSPEDALRDGRLELLVGVDASGEPGPHLTLEPGRLVDIDGPVGRFTVPELPSATRFLFIAGGTGISPLRSMLRHAVTDARRDRPDVRGFRKSSPTWMNSGRWLTRDAGAAHDGHARWGAEADESGSDHARGPGTAGARRGTLCFVCGPCARREMPVLQSLGVPRDFVRIEEWRWRSEVRTQK